MQLFIYGGWTIMFALAGLHILKLRNKLRYVQRDSDYFAQRCREARLFSRRECINCSNCGDPYHKSWGKLCPNCSGAD